MRFALAICPLWNTESPPLATAYLSAALRREGFSVSCFDFSIELANAVRESNPTILSELDMTGSWNHSFERWREELNLDSLADRWATQVLECEPDIVGFTIYDTTLNTSLMVAQAIKRRSPSTLVVFGGPSCHRASLIDRDAVDILAVGEGEITICELAAAVQSGRTLETVNGLVFKENGGAQTTPRRVEISDLDTIAFPDFTDYPRELYQPVLPMASSRGCPNRCSFCSESVQWKRFRWRSAENVVDEMAFQSESHKIQHFDMVDSLINGNLVQFRKMCALLIERDLGLTWAGKARADRRMSTQDIENAYTAGCRQLFFGIESFSPSVLDHMQKHVDTASVERVVRDTHRAGIQVGAFFIVGYLTETEEDFQRTLDFVQANREYIDIISYSPLWIQERSPLHSMADHFGIILPRHSPDGAWRSADGSNTVELRTERAERFGNLVKDLYPTP